MSIQWYPGHMHKARREISQIMPSIDIVIEILDARIPASSQNPLIEKLRNGKPSLKVLNKSDLADPAITRKWLSFLQKKSDVKAIDLSAKRKDSFKIIELCKILAPAKGSADKPLRALIAGIPNVGKSTLINSLSGTKIAHVADEPAVTKMQQKVMLGKGIVLCDTPGILWPKIDNERSGYHLAATGAVGKNAMDPLDVAQFAASILIERYPGLIKAHYSETPQDGLALLESIAMRKGCVKSGGKADLDKAAQIFLKEFRSGAIGKISLESPEE